MKTIAFKMLFLAVFRQFYLFSLGAREFRSDSTTHFDEIEIEVYDAGRDFAHWITFRRWDS